jgi:7-cyano-7-deazaguanine synthase
MIIEATDADPLSPLAVLISGGLDSAVLLGESLGRHPIVHPVYICTGSTWETIEQMYLRRFLESIASPNLGKLVLLTQPVNDLYGAHWSMTGTLVPNAHSPDEAVYLPGRNILLLAKSLLWCHLNDVPQIALAPLAANPFPDATIEFFNEFARVVNRAVNGATRVVAPFLRLSKVDVIRRGRGLPLEHTFSCMSPAAGIHCGACNKCAERQRAFADAGVADPTAYRSE